MFKLADLFSLTCILWATVPIASMVFAEAFHDVSGEDQK